MKHTGPGNLTISRPSYSDGTKVIRITVEDELSGIEFLTVEVGLEQFAEALTGLGAMDCQLEVYPDQIGKRAERKAEWVPMEITFLLDGAAREAAHRVALAPFEVDGWRAIGGRLGNRHYHSKRDGQDGYTVSFVRYVEAEAT